MRRSAMSKRLTLLLEIPTFLQFEHTLLQPFVGERQDSHILSRTLAPLDRRQDLLVEGSNISLRFRVGAVPTGVKWATVPAAVESWYKSGCRDFPNGQSKHHIPGLPFDLEVDVEKYEESGNGHLFIERWMPPETIEPVVRDALSSKLPKLVATRADKRLLLLEKSSL